MLHTTKTRGHPATNGLAERYVGDFKDKLKKIGKTGESLQAKFKRFLLTYTELSLPLQENHLVNY